MILSLEAIHSVLSFPCGRIESSNPVASLHLQLQTYIDPITSTSSWNYIIYHTRAPFNTIYTLPTSLEVWIIQIPNHRVLSEICLPTSWSKCNASWQKNNHDRWLPKLVQYRFCTWFDLRELSSWILELGVREWSHTLSAMVS